MQYLLNIQNICSLPYRQLRKLDYDLIPKMGRSLPYRQLRKIDEKGGLNAKSSLPYRQLRNEEMTQAHLKVGFTAI